MQPAQAPASRRHWKLEPASLELKPRLAEPLATVPDGPAKLGGITDTYTMVAFQVFSRHDLEALFSVGA